MSAVNGFMKSMGLSSFGAHEQKAASGLSEEAKKAVGVAVASVAAFFAVECLAGIAVSVVATGVFYGGVSLTAVTLAGVVDPTTAEGRANALAQSKKFVKGPEAALRSVKSLGVQAKNHPHVKVVLNAFDYLAEKVQGNNPQELASKYEVLKGSASVSGQRIVVDAAKASQVALVGIASYVALLVGANIVSSVVASTVLIGGLSVSALTLAGLVDPTTTEGRAAMLEKCEPTIEFAQGFFAEHVGKVNFFTSSGAAAGASSK